MNEARYDAVLPFLTENKKNSQIRALLRYIRGSIK